MPSSHPRVVTLFGSESVTYAPAPPIIGQSGPPLAINIANDAIADWSPERIFADVVKSSRIFPTTMDSNGWPTTDFTGWIVFADQIYGTLTYALSFTGQATLSGGTITEQYWDEGSNTTTAKVTAGSSLTMSFTNTKRQSGDSGNGVTNIKLMMPGHSTSEIFAHDLLNRINSTSNMFRGIRFMGYLYTNNSNLADWANRTLPSDAQQGPPAIDGSPGTQQGACYEYIIALCNQTNKDAWINIPYHATDDFVTKLAQAFRYGTDATGAPYTSDQASPVWPPLGAGLKLYVEFSNELWNGAGGFVHTPVNRTDATNEVNGGDPNHFNYDGINDAYAWAYRRVAYKALWHSNIFRSVFGDAAMMTQVRPVLAGKCSEASWVIGNGLGYLYTVWGPSNTYGNPQHPVNYYLYAISAAPYVEIPDQGIDGLTVDQVISQMQSYLTGSVQPWINNVYNLAANANYNIKMVAYEGGQHLFGLSAAAKLAAQTDTRMKQIYLDLIHYWFNKGSRAEAFFHWNLCSRWSSSGYWGLSNNITSENTPKWDAMKQIATGG